MFKELFGKSADPPPGTRGAGGDLGAFTLVLTGVEDPFDADPLWDRKYGGGAAIAEQTTGDRDFRLQTALDSCRNIGFARDSAGRFREQSPVFADVVVWLPESRWRADAEGGGDGLEALAADLTGLHRGKFLRSLTGGRGPAYTVMADDDLDEDQVAFQFGLGIFVPLDDDLLLGRVTLRATGAGVALDLPAWSFWRRGMEVTRPAGVYRGQDSFLITPHAAGPARAPIWFRHGKGHVLINLNAADTERVFADEANVRVGEAVAWAEGHGVVGWILEDARATGGEAETLVLELAPLDQPYAIPADVTGLQETRLYKPETGGVSGMKTKVYAPPEAPSAAPEEAPTKIFVAPDPAAPDPTGKEPTRRIDEPAEVTRLVSRLLTTPDRSADEAATPLSTAYALRLAGCALIRIDGDRRVSGLRGWTIWFDDDGRLVRRADAGAGNTSRFQAISARSEDEGLFHRPPGGGEFEPLGALPRELETGAGGALRLAPSPLPDVYHGILQLAPEATLPLSPEALVLGRSSSSEAERQPDIPLELFDHPDSLEWREGAGNPGFRLNSINLSRRHAALGLDQGRLRVEMAEGKMPVYVLDAEGRLRETVRKGHAGTLLDPGELIIVGGYLLRFHREAPMTMLSRDATLMRGGHSPRAGE